ncbi:hypothetical protein C493_19361 [Natronolimnohabitans innermongolicus JCM 12255]|uniref:Uncharacterized protein n=1 Tax=Natronolimnohabitans innermongolicus JCM 12255 TaxID=1227499 RepID=L9WLA5_9EURY|nr:hypothetical protein C493_19361 [Natronolimnohabitans innermongolicus JCM 12255]
MMRNENNVTCFGFRNSINFFTPIVRVDEFRCGRSSGSPKPIDNLADDIFVLGCRLMTGLRWSGLIRNRAYPQYVYVRIGQQIHNGIGDRYWIRQFDGDENTG